MELESPLNLFLSVKGPFPVTCSAAACWSHSLQPHTVKVHKQKKTINGLCFRIKPWQASHSEISHGSRLTTQAPTCLLQNTPGHITVCWSTKSTVFKLFVFIHTASGCPLQFQPALAVSCVISSWTAFAYVTGNGYSPHTWVHRRQHCTLPVHAICIS